MVVVKPLYDMAEAGVYWLFIYFKYYVKKLQITILIYDPCLLVTKESAEGFEIMGMQTDDTLGLSDDRFATRKAEIMSFKAKKRQFLDHQNPIIFNDCMLTADENNTLSLQQKNQAQQLQIVHNDAKYVQQRARGAYIAAICQPEASYNLFAAAQCRQPSKEETARLNSCIEWQMKNIDRGLNYIPLNMAKTKLYIMVNASFANNKDLSSQIGYIIIFGNEKKNKKSFKLVGNIVH
jgi:hypothetical protein